MRATTAKRAALGAGAALGLTYWAGFGPQTQLWGPFPYRGPVRSGGGHDGAAGPAPASGDDKVVALTFDDGPNEPFTSRLLDVLADRDVKATFFQVGRCAERFPSTTRRVVDEGHVLGNHSLDHSFTSYVRDPAQRDEVARAQEVLHRIGGRVPGLYRPPWLCHWPWVLGTVRRERLQVVSGTFGHPLEVLQPPARVLTEGLVRRARPGSILIMHDGRESRGGSRAETVASIGPAIDRLRERGYAFTTVEKILDVPAYAD